MVLTNVVRAVQEYVQSDNLRIFQSIHFSRSPYFTLDLAQCIQIAADCSKVQLALTALCATDYLVLSVMAGAPF